MGSSLLLGCGYVGFRHQEQAKEPVGKKAVLPSSKNPNRVTVLPSSKNIDAVLTNPSRQGTAADFIGSTTLPELPADKQVERALLPSSKIGAVLKARDAEAINRNNIDATLDARQQATPPEKEPPP